MSLSFSSDRIGIPVDIWINFTTTREIDQNELIIVNLPRFTRRYKDIGPWDDPRFYAKYDPRPYADYATFHIPMCKPGQKTGRLNINRSKHFYAAWVESRVFPDPKPTRGDQEVPHKDAQLHLMLTEPRQNRPDRPPKMTYFAPGSQISIQVFRSNGISVYCGFPGSHITNASSTRPQRTKQVWEPATNFFSIIANTTMNSSHIIETYPSMGEGCKSKGDCHGRGICNWCSMNCMCFPGHGHPTVSHPQVS